MKKTITRQGKKKELGTRITPCKPSDFQPQFLSNFVFPVKPQSKSRWHSKLTTRPWSEAWFIERFENYCGGLKKEKEKIRDFLSSSRASCL
jgi:hypothetical protein